jgi:hypothetical protein
MNIRLGPMYWKKPRVESLSRVAAAVKQSRGAVVTAPAAISSRLRCQSFWVRWLVGLSAKPHR